jgi:putative acyl-CoA dehydrogenase
MKTHEVFNQVPPLINVNFYENDQPLQAILSQHNIDWGIERLKSFGDLIGEEEWKQKGTLANKHEPTFQPHDAYGNRIDQADFHPAYHDLMQLWKEYGIHSLPWTEKRRGAHLIRMALYYMYNQNENGTACPLTMTFACVAPIKKYFPNAKEWLEKILDTRYNPENQSFTQKKSLTIGMAMTEKQGGTDVRANTTKALALGKAGAGEAYEIIGHKWFCSAPMCDAFLTLAQTEKGLSCFLIPRWRPDGRKNEMKIQRLKDKVGNRSNASSEVEFEGALGWLIGEEGRGVPTIIEMVALTRYDCMIGSSAMMRRGLSEVINHISYRKVMGKQLIHQPLMQNVVADLCLESEAALAMTYRACLCQENSENAEEQLLLRLLLPIGKYWITKRATFFNAEAMECLGGNGYVEDGILGRLFREAPVNAIWEGSGNVQCLDLLRVMVKTPEALDVYKKELEKAKGNNIIYDAYLENLYFDLEKYITEPFYARRITEKLAKSMQAAQLIRLGNSLISDAFCEARLTNEQNLLFGNLTDKIDCLKIIKRNQIHEMKKEVVL